MTRNSKQERYTTWLKTLHGFTVYFVSDDWLEFRRGGKRIPAKEHPGNFAVFPPGSFAEIDRDHDRLPPIAHDMAILFHTLQDADRFIKKNERSKIQREPVDVVVMAICSSGRWSTYGGNPHDPIYMTPVRFVGVNAKTGSTIFRTCEGDKAFPHKVLEVHPYVPGVTEKILSNYVALWNQSVKIDAAFRKAKQDLPVLRYLDEHHQEKTEGRLWADIPPGAYRRKSLGKLEAIRQEQHYVWLARMQTEFYRRLGAGETGRTAGIAARKALLPSRPDPSGVVSNALGLKKKTPRASL